MGSMNVNKYDKINIQRPEEFLEYYNKIMDGSNWTEVPSRQVYLNEDFKQFSIYDPSGWETNANTTKILNKI